MRRRELLFATVAAGSYPLGAIALERMPRIGLLGPNPGAFSALLETSLREIGLRDGETIIVERRWAAGNFGQLTELAAELVRLPVDLLVTISHRVALIAKKVTSTIPIVFTAVNDPVGVGLVPSLAHPDGNITGLSLEGYDLIGKRVQLLQEIVPGLSVVAYLTDPTEPYSPAYVKEVQDASQKLGLHPPRILPARTPEEAVSLVGELAQQQAEALLVEPNSVNFARREEIADASLAKRLPAMYGLRQFMDPSSLMSYGTALPEHFRRAAAYVEKILNGAKPADIPVEQPTKFELVINLKTAAAIGLTIPQATLTRADELIE
jgi:putative tryptophan/tyrosine transport system substrate-binding protein